MDMIEKLLGSELIQNVIIVIVGLISAAIYKRIPNAKTMVDKYKGEIIRAIKLAEKEITPAHTNPGLRKLDKALQVVIQLIEKAEARTVSAKEAAEIRSAISEIHNEVFPPEIQ